MHEMHEDMYCMHRILHVGKNIGNYIYYNEPLMIIIALMLALVGKTNDDMDPYEYVAEADECD